MNAARPDAIMLSSFTVHPDMPSEPGVGWQFLIATLEQAVSVGARVVLVTMRRSAEAILGRVPVHLASALDVETVHLPYEPAFFRWHEPRFTRVEHEIWVRRAGPVVRAVEARYRLVYAHHVTFATDILTTPITRLSPDVFKVWGPIGAGGVARVYSRPPRTRSALVQAALQRLRDVVVALPASSVAKRVDLVLAQNGATERALAKAGTEVRVFPNVVVDVDRAATTAPRRRTSLELLTVGHLIARKRQDLAILALTSPLLRNATLHIVGATATPYGHHLVEYAHRLGVAGRVMFHDSLPRDAVLRMMIDADVLVHLSGREGASGVVGEAATCGLPVVCFAGTGAASVLDESGTSGVTLAADVSEQRVAEAILQAARMPRSSTDLWSADRFRALSARLYRDGSAYCGARASRTSGGA